MDVQEQLEKKTSSSRRNFQLPLPVFFYFFPLTEEASTFISCEQATFLHTAQEHYFFTLSHYSGTPWRSRIQWKKKRKEKKNKPGWQWHNAHCRQVSRAGHPGTMENALSQQLPGLCSTVTKRSSISWQSPITDLLSWVQSGHPSFSYHNDISLCRARHFGLCTGLAQGSVKKYFTRE